MTRFSRSPALRPAMGLLLATGVCVAPAMAQDVAIAFDPGEIVAVDSSIDAETLRAIFSGEIAPHADALAGLNAGSITLPRLVLITTHAGRTDTVVYSDLVFSDIVDGVAASVSMAGASMAHDDTRLDLGRLSARDFNIPGVLAYYGLVPAADPEAFQTVYADVEFEGGHIVFERGSCAIGPASLGDFSARPLHTPFLETIEAARTLAESEGSMPPETARLLIAFYSDLLTSFRSSEMRFDGFACKGLSSDDKAVRFAFGPLTMGGFSPGVYPAVTLDNLEVAVDDAGQVSTVLVGQGVFKGFDYARVLAALAEFPVEEGESWLEANAHRLIPEFGGLGARSIAYDGVDPDTGEPLAFSLGAFDLELGGYTNGIPTSIRSHTRNFVLPIEAVLDEGDADPAAQALRASGLEELNLSQWLDAEWDAGREVVVLRSYGVEALGLGAVDVSAELINASEALFSLNGMRTAMTAMQLAVDNVTVEIADTGALELFMQIAAAEGEVGPRTVRAFVAEGAERALSDELGERAEGLIVAVGNFLREGGTLTLEARSRDGEGVGVLELARVETDPLALLARFDIKARWR